MVIDGALNKINIIQAYINNGFVHTGTPLDITRTYAYLTEYIRGLKRIIQVFGYLIDLMERFRFPAERAEDLYIALDEAITDLTRLHNHIGDQLNLVTI